MYNVLHPWKKQPHAIFFNLSLIALVIGVSISFKYIMDYYLGFLEFKSTTCTINNITYPTEPFSMTYRYNWAKCQCDSDSSSGYGVMPCIGLYDTNLSNKMIINYYTGIGSSNSDTDNDGNSKYNTDYDCTWKLTKMCTCDTPYKTIQAYLDNMYNYTIYTNFNCHYKGNSQNPQIYFNIGSSSDLNLSLFIPFALIPTCILILYMNIASFMNNECYMSPFILLLDYNKDERNFYIVDIWMWILLIVKAFYVIGSCVYCCCKPCIECCFTIDTSIRNASISCFKFKSEQTKPLLINEDEANGDIEYCKTYGSTTSEKSSDLFEA